MIALSEMDVQSIKPALLQRIAGGDSTALNDCIAQYGALVWSLARRSSRTPADAEDATQEIFLNIWRGAILFDPRKGCEATFIVMVARRRLIDRQRKWKAELLIDSTIDVAEAPARNDTVASLHASLRAEAAMGALQRLRPDQRRLLELNLIVGLTQAEIAERLGIPLGTVKSQIRRGLMFVRECMRLSADPDSNKNHVAVSPVSQSSSGKRLEGAGRPRPRVRSLGAAG